MTQSTWAMIGLATVLGALAYSSYLVWKSMRKSSASATTPPATGTPAAGTATTPAATTPPATATPATTKGKAWIWAALVAILSIAIGFIIAYQNDVGPLLSSVTKTGATPAASPAPATTAPKATVNKGKGTVIKVPGKVPGDNAWKHAYIFQLKSGYLRFQWDIEGPMGWEVRDEKTGKVYSDADVKDPNKKVPIPQNGWIRIRAKGSAPLQVTVYTYW